MGVGIVRLLEPKPVGGFFEQESDMLFSATHHQRVTEVFSRSNTAKEFRSHPLVVLPTHIEAPHRLGCGMGGHSISYVDSRGNVTPCVFLPVAFGNILTEDLPSIFNRMSEVVPRRIHAECPAATFAGTLRKQVERGLALPIPHKAVKTQFDALSLATHMPTDSTHPVPRSSRQAAQSRT